MNGTLRTGRRRALALSGSALVTAIAGCSGQSDDDTSPRDLELREADWEDVEAIKVNGLTSGWIGVEPEVIEGVRNPPILLSEGTDYEFTWENRDGATHNLAIRDEAGSLIENYDTGFLRERGDIATLSIEASPEMHQYVCDPHPRSMIGYFRIVEA